MIGFPKPRRGSALLAARTRRANRVAAEQKIMRQARRRDHGECRWPRCAYKSKSLPIDVCHDRHRGMGGNPSGGRTRLNELISLCRVHHGQLDAHEIGIETQGNQMFSGPCDFYQRTESGRMELVWSETKIGVSVERSQS